ncbi:MAG: hypothetical protein HGB03_00505 [Candidatus Yonathbacteria bacterium]|nr:hypothetical protein [Candidatus Yonathbacteria bacterium]NTW47744.1 hypothetical protein [Candidatus Yonathbacteria bacterium]
MADNTTIERQIIDGPGLWDLAMSFFEGKEVVFKIKTAGVLPRALAFGFKEKSIITGILQEDGSRRRFILQTIDPEHGGSHLLYYDVERRTGTVVTDDKYLGIAKKKKFVIHT